ncbi:MAG: plasmid mobilization relaxosome protein MobC [Lachnospiraceae bacterium]|nr:plasmid mobilization relaxosome protein MobC [Lachnospiraceae bacterium]
MRHYKKKETDPKTYRVTVRFNEESYKKVVAMAKAANLSAAELIRQMVFKGKVNVKQEVVAEVPMLKKLIADFGKIGSNLNQIAHHYNGGGVRSREMYERTQRAISELYAMKYEIEKMGGEFRGYSEAYRRKKQ